MKKFIICLLVAICLAGVIYLGVVVFRAKNIESVELDGEMQTLYMVDDNIDFENSKLKVTYKNGTIKMIDLNSNDVQINLFSTSIEKHGKMNIVYKSFTINVEYDVIKKGCYFVESTETKSFNSDGSENTSKSPVYNKDTTNQIFYLDDNGVLKYYQYIEGKWYLNDGKYDNSYNYIIEGDTIKVNIGENKKLELVANYDEDQNNNATIFLTSKEHTSSSDGLFVTSITNTTYAWYGMKTNRTIRDVPELDLSKTTTISDPNVVQGNPYVVFQRGETIESSGKEIYIKVTIANDDYLKEVYVRVTDMMVQRNSLNTTNLTTPTYALMFYESKDFYLFYSVVD